VQVYTEHILSMLSIHLHILDPDAENDILNTMCKEAGIYLYGRKLASIHILVY
jgi:hypothetical protein